jgi:O-methyltransferase
MDAFAYPWKIPECDGIFIGNFLHGFPDEACVRICREAYERLEPGGKLWVHEMLWNANKDGPLITGLWNASMRVANGAQRTAEELKEILRAAGFESPYVVPSISPFSLLAAQKRA